MKHTKIKNRSRITHANLEAALRIATSQLNPNYDIIINQEHSKFNPSHQVKFIVFILLHNKNVNYKFYFYL